MNIPTLNDIYSKSNVPTFNPAKESQTQRNLTKILEGDVNKPSTWTIK